MCSSDDMRSSDQRASDPINAGPAPCLRCCEFITDEQLEREAERYGAAGGDPQVVWPNGVRSLHRPSASYRSIADALAQIAVRLCLDGVRRQLKNRSRPATGLRASNDTRSRTIHPRKKEIRTSMREARDLRRQPMMGIRVGTGVLIRSG
jgi:hypothetical protein